jgi:quercetin dioxygenase-like cupin family protein
LWDGEAASHARLNKGSVMAATVNITAVTTSLLAEAHDAPSGRAGRTLQSEAHAPLKQTLLALRESQCLADHAAPGPASLMVVHGSVILRSSEGDFDLNEGDWAPVPRTTHSLHAKDDAVVLLTVAAVQAAPRRTL